MNGYDIPDRLARDIEALLNADPFNATVPVVRVEPWDTTQTIEQKLATLTVKATKLGAGLLVLPVDEADDESSNLEAAVMTYKIAVQAFTIRELNEQSGGSQKTAHQLIRQAAEWLKPVRLDGVTTDFVPDKPFIEQVSDKDNPKLDIWQLNFRASEADDETTQRIASVVISAAGALPAVTVTLTCATAAASLYYTTDGTLPSAGNASATLYSAPFAVAAAATVRAAAYKTGLFPQIISSLKIT